MLPARVRIGFSSDAALTHLPVKLGVLKGNLALTGNTSGSIFFSSKVIRVQVLLNFSSVIRV